MKRDSMIVRGVGEGGGRKNFRIEPPPILVAEKIYRASSQNGQTKFFGSPPMQPIDLATK